MNGKIQIGDCRIGESQPCFIIAEAGSNHNGSYEQALRLIDVASGAGADAVKFQVFKAARMYPKGSGESDYLKIPKGIYDIIAEMEMPLDWLPGLKEHCDRAGIEFMASAFDQDSAKVLDPFVTSFKIASYEMNHHPLIEFVADFGKPVVVSTGAANLDEVREMVACFQNTGNKDLVLMQCTAAYPAPLDSLNVKAVATMKKEFGLPVGFSDHSRDPLVGPLAAVALGADVIEKHYTLSNELPGPDHRFAVEPDELKLMVEKIREAEIALGSGEKVYGKVEEELRSFARRSVFAIADIKAGEPFTEKNVDVLRNGKLSPGIEPKALPEILGRKAARFIPAETALQRQDVS
jgi:N-acetylneuraminate synthase